MYFIQSCNCGASMEDMSVTKTLDICVHGHKLDKLKSAVKRCWLVICLLCACRGTEAAASSVAPPYLFRLGL